MSKRDGYEPGVPCWVATVHPDPEKAVVFYTELFGWEATNVMSPESSEEYYICKRRGRDVAAISSEQDGAPDGPLWLQVPGDTPTGARDVKQLQRIEVRILRD